MVVETSSGEGEILEVHQVRGDRLIRATNPQAQPLEDIENGKGDLTTPLKQLDELHKAERAELIARRHQISAKYKGKHVSKELHEEMGKFFEEFGTVLKRHEREMIDLARRFTAKKLAAVVHPKIAQPLQHRMEELMAS
jgi:hypothetical protein